MSDNILTLVIGDDPPPRLDKALAAAAPEAAGLSRSQLVRLIGEGAVSRRGGAAVTALKTRTRPGEVWEIRLPAPVPAAAMPEAIPLDIVFEDDALIVVDKPAGMVVHPAPGAPGGTLVNALLHHCAGSLSGIGGVLRPGIVHRIDRGTSGLLVVAKTDTAHRHLAAQFRAHSVERRYRALVFGVPERADPRLAGVRGVAFEPGGVIRISGNIARHNADRKRMRVVADAGRHAITRCRVLERFGADALALLDCWLETGRTHQIRVHLAHAGHGLVGDATYGGRRRIRAGALPEPGRTAAAGFGRQALHAATLGFSHPESGETMRFEAPLPADFAALLAALRAPRTP